MVQYMLLFIIECYLECLIVIMLHNIVVNIYERYLIIL